MTGASEAPLRIVAWGNYDTGKPRVRILLRESRGSDRTLNKGAPLSMGRPYPAGQDRTKQRNGW